MDRIRNFLAHAIRLETEAARRFDELAEHMATHGNREVEAVFRQFADYSRQHLKEAMARAGFRYLSELPLGGYDWPDGEAPESAPWWGVDAMMDMEAATRLALRSERSGRDFYQGIAERSGDPRVRVMAAEFAAEEEEHVNALQTMLSALQGKASPSPHI